MSKQAVYPELEDEVYPDGYAEALADCTVLAARLLKMALQNEQKRKHGGD
jgi:hypothetical protein